jgi:hypothetical protein
VKQSSLLGALIALAGGFLFAVGLAIAGMTQPSKVVGFLDVAGDWDPSLAFVMFGAVAVYMLGHRLVLRRDAPLLGSGFHLPTRRDIDPRLVIGSAIFGVGWGLAGYCPGPVIAALGSGLAVPLVFVAAMALGVLLHDALGKRIGS